MTTSSTLKAGILAIAMVGITMSAINSAHACTCCDTYNVRNVAHWDVLNVRTGPGNRYTIVGALRPNERCISLSGERKGRWVYIYANESGQRGWVHSRYLRFIHGE